MRCGNPPSQSTKPSRLVSRPTTLQTLVGNLAAARMVALDSDWGDPGFVGDYPALSSGTEPSAPGKRAKRTFNKHQHALQQLVAETVVLQPRNGVRKPSEPSAVTLRNHTHVDEGAKDGNERAEGINRKRKRKRGAAGPGKTPESTDKVQVGVAVAAGAGPATAVPLGRAKRQRNKFKPHFGEAASATAASGAEAAHQQPGQEGRSVPQHEQSSAECHMSPHKRRPDAQARPSGGKGATAGRADVERPDAGRVEAEASSVRADAVQETAPQRSIGVGVSSGAGVLVRAEQRIRKGKDGGPHNSSKKCRKTEKQDHAQGNGSLAAQEPSAACEW